MKTTSTVFAIETYLRARDAEEKRRVEEGNRIFDLEKMAAAANIPENLRPATANDCARIGQLIWHKDGDDGPYWNIVHTPLHYGDAFKAYTSKDGYRDGLKDAFVEVEP